MARKLSLRRLQDATGIDRRRLSNLEGGRIADAAEAEIRAVADALSVPVAAITQGEDVPTTATTDPPVAPDLNADELRRWSPEEVEENRWLPWTARKIREKVYRREIYAHTDGGRITFTADDIRRTSALGQITPFEAPAHTG